MNAKIEALLNRYTRQSRALDATRKVFVDEIGKAIAGRLDQLFAQRSDEDKKKWPTFGRWLSSWFEYDHYSVTDIFRVDEILKELNAATQRINALREVSVATNVYLKKKGHRVGLDDRLSDTAKI